MELCGAKAKSGGLCKHQAGLGTSHLGQGRCKFHGGNAQVKHGRYSTIKRPEIRALIEKHEADPDPLDLKPELAACRALFEDFIGRYDEWRKAVLAWHSSWTNEKEINIRAKPRQILDIADAYRLISEVSKIVARIEHIKAANAIGIADLNRIMQEMGRVVERYVGDEAIQEKIRDGWLDIKL